MKCKNLSQIGKHNHYTNSAQVKALTMYDMAVSMK